jgi:hypothetical protein
MKHIINVNGNIFFLDTELNNKNEELNGLIVDWNIISNYIIYKKNNLDNGLKVLIFCDSFLLNIIPLYLELFDEVYIAKKIYDVELIKLVNPNYVFEFRLERFLI